MWEKDTALYFTFRGGDDVGSAVKLDWSTGEFDGLQAYDDMASLTRHDEPGGPEGYYLQVGVHRFDVEQIPGLCMFRVIDLEGLQRVAEMASEKRLGV